MSRGNIVYGPLFILYNLGVFITLRSWLFLTIAPTAPVTTVFLLLIGSHAGGLILLAATMLAFRHDHADPWGEKAARPAATTIVGRA